MSELEIEKKQQHVVDWISLQECSELYFTLWKHWINTYSYIQNWKNAELLNAININESLS